jgi:hypothetical protein
MIHTNLRRSIFALDAAAAAGLTLVVLVVFVVAVQQFSNSRRDGDCRRMARMAAEAELERLRTVGVDSAGQPRLPAPEHANGVTIESRTAAGEGPWAGMMMVTLVARKVGPGYKAEVELAAFIPITPDVAEKPE